MGQALPGPLQGLRVLDFTNMLAGPYCTRLLADHGAEVIKVEPPEGDHNRNRRPVRDGHSSFFGHVNCGKRSIVLNLKSPEARAHALALADTADIVVENWRPGVAARLGLDHPTLSARRAGLIYCSISGFGQEGPGALRPAYAPIVHAASGFDLAQLLYQNQKAPNARPANTATFIADVMGGLAGFAAIQTALYHRQNTGAGQFVDVSLLDCMLNLMVYEIQEAQSPSPAPIRVYQPLRARDGYVVTAPTSQRNFEVLCRTIGHPEWIADPRFATTKIREENWEALMRLIEDWTSPRGAAECESILLEAGVPCTRYHSVAEVLADPQTLGRGSFTRVADPAGSYLVPNAPFRMPGLAIAARPHVPALGEDNAAILNGLRRRDISP